MQISANDAAKFRTALQKYQSTKKKRIREAIDKIGVENRIYNSYPSDSAIKITDDEVEVYDYYRWRCSPHSEILFCSDGIRWKVGKEDEVEFMPYNDIRPDSSISQLPDQISKVQGALKAFMSQDFQKILRGEE